MSEKEAGKANCKKLAGGHKGESASLLPEDIQGSM